MRLHRIGLKHFAGVDEAEVPFGRGVTLIVGPNEVGKSSLKQALGLLFDNLDSSKAAEVRAVVPVDQDGVGPEVWVEAEAGPYRFDYRKRWRFQPHTRLRITAPRPETLAGREAHERVRAIIDEHADLELFETLQLDQGSPLEATRLNRSPSLLQALDRAAGGEARPGQDDGLLARTETEYLRYWTAGRGEPTGELRQARAVDEQARGRLAELDARLDDLGQALAAVASGERALTKQDALIARLGQQLAEQREAMTGIRTLERRIDSLVADEARERLTLHRAEQARNDRAAAIAEAAREGALIDDIAKRLAPARAEREARRIDATDAAAAHAAAKAEQEGAEQARAAAEQAKARREAETALDALKRRIGQIETRQQRRRTLAAEIGRIGIDEPALDRLQRADNALRLAAGALSGQAPRLRIEARTEVHLQVAGKQETIAPNQPRDVPVTAPMALDLPDLLALKIDPGASLAERRREHAEAADALGEACAALGVDDLAEARRLFQRRTDLDRQRSDTDTELRLLLDGRALDDLKAELATHQATLADLGPAADAAAQAPGAIDTALSEARRRLDAATREREAKREALDLAERAALRADQTFATLEIEHGRAKAQYAAARQRLAGARAEVSDERIEIRYGDAVTAHREAERRLAGERDALVALDPRATRLKLDSAASAERRACDERAEHRDRLNQARGLIAGLREEGLGEQRDQAEAEAERAARGLAAVQRRADAARRLRETLHRHRDAQRRRYLAPFQARVQELVRLVQGPQVQIALDDNLAVVERTIGTTTVPFASLSGGAQEQIGLACRLAAAMLVADDGGVPVLLDDTLGYSDPERLTRLGAMIDYAGRRAQIIILTCQGDRFAGVGSAEVRRLVHR